MVGFHLQRTARHALAAAALALMAHAALAAGAEFDFSPQQANRVRADKDPSAIRAIAPGFKFVKDGALTVAIAPFAPPIST